MGWVWCVLGWVRLVGRLLIEVGKKLGWGVRKREEVGWGGGVGKGMMGWGGGAEGFGSGVGGVVWEVGGMGVGEGGGVLVPCRV